MNAAEIANLSNVKIINESIATGLDFGLFKKGEMSEASKNVAFLDLGHSKLSASLLKFS